jgi:hypothetical protein
MRALVMITLGVTSACGGREAIGPSDAAPPWQAGPADEAGYTRCATPEGWGICGPATGCEASLGRPGCSTCIYPALGDSGVGMCDSLHAMVVEHSLETAISIFDCDDGWVRYDYLSGPRDSGIPDALPCVPYSVGVILSRYISDTNRLRYADYGFFTGAPLPTPPTCPTVSGFQPCDGPCASCTSGELCTGRSPLHPYSFCLDESKDYSPCSAFGRRCPQDAGAGAVGCFLFTVEPQAQTIADVFGTCMPLAQCQAMAAQLPGGGTCTP